MTAPDPNLARRLGPGVPRGMLFWAEVVAHPAGPPPTLDLKIQGSADVVQGVRYMAGYAPTNGDLVWGLRQGHDKIVLGLLAS